MDCPKCTGKGEKIDFINKGSAKKKLEKPVFRCKKCQTVYYGGDLGTATTLIESLIDKYLK